MDGEVFEICFNVYIVDVIDLFFEQIEFFMLVYCKIMVMMCDFKYVVLFKFEGGEMVVFDNCCVLYGCEVFDL